MDDWLGAPRRWPALLELIDGLPQASRFREAVLNDPEVAEEVARERFEQGDDGDGKWRPALRDWDLQALMLAQLIDAVQYNTAVTFATAGAKPPKGENFPVPQSAIDEALERIKSEHHRETAGMFGF